MVGVKLRVFLVPTAFFKNFAKLDHFGVVILKFRFVGNEERFNEPLIKNGDLFDLSSGAVKVVSSFLF